MVIQVSDILIKTNIKFVFNIDSGRLDNILLNEAAKLSKIPVYSFCHGYLHGGKKSQFIKKYILDYFLVWDLHNKNKIRDLFEDDKKIIVFGYPKYDKKYLNNYIQKNPKIKLIYDFLIVLSYESIKTIDYILTYFGSKEFLEKKILVRFHHENIKNKDLIIDLIRIYPNINYSFSGKENLINLFLSSKKILGCNTSVLFEAYVIGKQVFQIESKKIPKTNYYSFIPSINIDKFYEKSVIHVKERINNRVILVDDIEEKISMIIHDL